MQKASDVDVKELGQRSQMCLEASFKDFLLQRLETLEDLTKEKIEDAQELIKEQEEEKAPDRVRQLVIGSKEIWERNLAQTRSAMDQVEEIGECK